MITREEVLKIARLAKLSVNDDEIESLTHDMTEIINFADTINTLVKDEDMEDFDDINNIVNAFHKDVVEESFDRKLILKNAEGGDDGYFLVKRRNAK
nr:Asp-tRNA(Asn)/Glu-tRNA(Gln) amidotransferase subunit GatC [Sedimentibacter sp.]